MRIFIITGVLCLLLVFCGCGENQEDECQLDDDGHFQRYSLDVKFTNIYDEGLCQEFNATLTGMPFTNASGYFILRDGERNDYRFEPLFSMDWEGQLDGLQLGKTYRFVFSVFAGRRISGMKVFDGASLLYLAASYSDSAADYSAFELVGLEGFTTEQLRESKCDPEKDVHDGYISLITNLPVVFGYEEQSATLYPTEEATFSTPEGEFLVHLLSSTFDNPQNYDNGGYFYSFYIKRL